MNYFILAIVAALAVDMSGILEQAEEVLAFVSAVVGFLSGWFGKKKRDEFNAKKIKLN